MKFRMFGSPHCRDWTPLATQQLRLRHLVRIIGYNVSLDPSVGKGLYYTLHVATMCSPFYTSEILLSNNPKWTDFEINADNGFNSGVVIRIWQHKETKTDNIITVWGISFSGLVYLGTKLSEIQPSSFESNTLIFQFVGGYFTSQHCLKIIPNKSLPFINYINIITNEESHIFRNTSKIFPKNEVRKSYNIEKLQKLHTIQQSIRNRKLDAEVLREKISEKLPLFEKPNSNINDDNNKRVMKQNINTLSMSITSLNRLLNQQSKPSRFQRIEVLRVRKLIEVAKFKCKMLSQEKDRKTAQLRHLTEMYKKLCDENDDQGSLLMDRYRQLSRELEKLREWRKSYIDMREMYLHVSVYLNLRQKELMSELLNIYPIIKVSDERYTICGVHLPDSESLSHNDDTALSVALGYVSHTVQMCSIFLQVPLRYPIIHYGSRSKIIDHISDKIPEKEREFPLYARGKDQLQFHYAVYLLNKNIAQLRWYCGLPTQDLRATLNNLLSLLHFRQELNTDKTLISTTRSQSGSSIDLKTINLPLSSNKNKKKKLSRSIGSLRLSESKKMSRSVETIVNIETGTKPILTKMLASNVNSNCDNLHTSDNGQNNHLTHSTLDNNIEQGLDLLDPRTNFLFCSSNEHSVDALDSNQITNKHRTTRSVGSYTEDEINSKCEKVSSSDPLLNKRGVNVGDQSLPSSFQEERNEFLQEWLANGPALVCSEENLYPDEILGTTVEDQSNSVNGGSYVVNDMRYSAADQYFS